MQNPLKKNQNKRFKVIKHKVTEIRAEINKVEEYIAQNINTVENFIGIFISIIIVI